MGGTIEKKDSRWKIKGKVWRTRIFTSEPVLEILNNLWGLGTELE
jgi:hypothetical protein